MGISTHILDTSLGIPAKDVDIRLEYQDQNKNWVFMGEGRTDLDGRIKRLLSEENILKIGYYQITFYIEKYFKKLDQPSFYPQATIMFSVLDTSQHYHIPLLLNPFGYTTYRGS